MSKQERISLDVDFTQPWQIIKKPDGTIWLHYRSTDGKYREIPITVIGLGDLLGSRVTLSGLQANLVEPKDINRFPTSLNPTGQVIYQDDFEATTIKWTTIQGAGGETAVGGRVRSTADRYPLRGEACLLINSGYGPSASFHEVDRHLHVGLFGNGRFGFEHWWGGNPEYLDFLSWIFDFDSRVRNVSYLPEIRYKHAENKWYYKDEAGVFKELDGAPPYINIDLVNHKNYFKMVVDFTKVEYAYVIINGTKVDMSGIPLCSTSPVNADNIEPGWRVGSPAGATGHAQMIVDDVIITGNEP